MVESNKKNDKPRFLKNLAIYSIGGFGCLLTGVGMLVFVLFLISAFVDGLTNLWHDMLTLLPIAFVIGIIWLIRRGMRGNKAK